MAIWMTIVLLLFLTGSPSCDASEGAGTTEGRIAVVVVDVDGEPISGAGLSLCPLESGQLHARGTEDNQCLYQASGADGAAAFEAVPPGRYRLTSGLEGFADTSVFPLSIAAPRPDPKAPDSVTLVLNAVCYDC